MSRLRPFFCPRDSELLFGNLEMGAFEKGALRKFVANFGAKFCAKLSLRPAFRCQAISSRCCHCGTTPIFLTWKLAHGGWAPHTETHCDRHHELQTALREVAQIFAGNFAQILRKLWTFFRNLVLLRQRRLRKFCGNSLKYAENFRREVRVQIPLRGACGSANFRNSEKGAFTKGALRQFLRKFCASFASSSFREEGRAKLCANLYANWKSISDKFMQIPLFQCPHLRISDLSEQFRARTLQPLFWSAEWTSEEAPRDHPWEVKFPQNWHPTDPALIRPALGARKECVCKFKKLRADFREGDDDSNLQFSESGGSLNGPDLFTELPFLYKSWPNAWFTELPPPFSLKPLFFTEKCFVASPSQQSALKNEGIT